MIRASQKAYKGLKKDTASGTDTLNAKESVCPRSGQTEVIILAFWKVTFPYSTCQTKNDLPMMCTHLHFCLHLLQQASPFLGAVVLWTLGWLSYGTEKGLGRGKGEPQTTALLELSCCPVLKLRIIITCCLKSHPSFKGGSPLGVRWGACSTKENSGSDPRLHGHCHHWETCKNSSGAGEGSGTQVPTCSEISSGVLTCSQGSVNNWGS